MYQVALMHCKAKKDPKKLDARYQEKVLGWLRMLEVNPLLGRKWPMNSRVPIDCKFLYASFTPLILRIK